MKKKSPSLKLKKSVVLLFPASQPLYAGMAAPTKPYVSCAIKCSASVSTCLPA